MLTALAATGFWTETVGLVFTWVVLLPAVATALIVVAMVSARGDKKADDELRGRWGRRGSGTDS
ncbi:MAG TPA: hypothetical protein VNA28_15365 [Solirubrobacteraceae bacterium]|nr:hypothetical protein [Solirubrobacteraceae bacterium]